MANVAHEPVKRAMSRIRELSADEETRRLAFVRERALHDEVSLLNDAKREGLQEGEERGRLGEARDNLRSLVRLKFGDVPPWVTECVERAGHEQLKIWMDKILFAESLDTMFKQ